jgi:hypothetical protein
MAGGSGMTNNNKEVTYADVLDLESVVIRSNEEDEAQRATPRVLTRVMCWGNGMVMAFDQFGQQMPEFQGRKADVMEKIYAAATKDTVIEGDVVPLRWRR